MAGKDERIIIRCSTAEKLFFEEAAAQEGMNISSWLRALAHARALEVIIPNAVGEPAAAFQPGFGLTNEED